MRGLQAACEALLAKFLILVWHPKGGHGCQMSFPCLESQGCRVIPFFRSPVSFFFYLVLLPFWVLSLLCEIMVHSPDFFPRKFLDMFH